MKNNTQLFIVKMFAGQIDSKTVFFTGSMDLPGSLNSSFCVLSRSLLSQDPMHEQLLALLNKYISWRQNS